MASTKRLLQSLINAIFPRYCCVCGKRLLLGEHTLCISCLTHLPMTHIKGHKNNIIERLLWDDLIYTEHANSLLYYHPKSLYCNIYFKFKYQNRPDVAVAFGRIMAQDLIGTDFFNGIDCIIPVPLSKQRFRKRGYNQSERLAHGISEITHIPVDTTSLIRIKDNPTQTHLGHSERQANVKDIFRLISPTQLQNKHILIVDDVITTGATTKACAHAILQSIKAKNSIISLGFASERLDVDVPHWIRK